MVTGVPGGRARSALAGGPGARFADVRWVAETGSTNADALALARDGAPEGIVLVADHQTAGRGRRGPHVGGAAGRRRCCVSVLLRPPAAVVDAATMAVGVAAAEAVEAVAGVAPRLKWPNDLVWPGDGSAPDRKLAGILAEADWPRRRRRRGGWPPPAPAERVVVVVGIGINVNWPADAARRPGRHRRRAQPRRRRATSTARTCCRLASQRLDRATTPLVADGTGAAARRVAGPVGHPRPPGPGRPRRRRRRGHRRRRHRRGPPRGRHRRGRAPVVAVGDVVHLR